MGHRALIIDDNSDNLGILAEMLIQEGIEATEVSDPIELQPLLEDDTRFDVIFLDLELPHFDGYEVIEQLKQHKGLRDVPVVAYTVHVSEINAVREHGFHSFLPKPLDADNFPAQLARILKGERVWSRL